MLLGKAIAYLDPWRYTEILPNKNSLTAIYARGPCIRECPGGRLNKKDGLTRYGDSHVKDKTS